MIMGDGCYLVGALVSFVFPFYFTCGSFPPIFVIPPKLAIDLYMPSQPHRWISLWIASVIFFHLLSFLLYPSENVEFMCC